MTDPETKRHWKYTLAENFLLLIAGLYLLFVLACVLLYSLFSVFVVQFAASIPATCVVVMVPVMYLASALFIMSYVRNRLYARSFIMALVPWLFLVFVVVAVPLLMRST
jgi:hypothetical protein